ncbi:MAG: hypothetical protein K6348_02615 [Deferribacterales bacterium]
MPTDHDQHHHFDDREVRKKLNAISDKFKDIRPVMLEIAGILHNYKITP